MTTYRVLVEDQALWEMRQQGAMLPAGFRVGDTIGPAGYSSSVVRVEDDDAPPELEGLLVELTFQADFDVNGNAAEVRIMDRRVVRPS